MVAAAAQLGCCRASAGSLAAGRGLGPGRALGSPALLALSGGRRWGWGLVTFAQPSGLSSGRRAPGRTAAVSATAAFPPTTARELGPLGFLTCPPPAP